MKLINWFILLLFSAFSCAAGTNIITPILNGQLQSNLNDNNNSETNVASIVFHDGTTQTTAGGGSSNSVAATNGTAVGLTMTGNATNSATTLYSGNNQHNGNETFAGAFALPSIMGAGNGFLTSTAGVIGGSIAAAAQIAVANALGVPAAVTVSGDVTANTNGAFTLAATGTAGTYGQATFDAKGRETSGVVAADIAHGGTGQTTASAALTALGAGGNSTIITPIIQPLNGSTGPTVLFPATANQLTDQPFILSGSPWTSGAGLFTGLKMTNAINSTDANGYYTWDAIAFAFVSVGFQATNVDSPGCNLIVANFGEPIVLAHPQGSTGNLPGLYIAGDATNGYVAEIPYNDGVSNHIQPLPLRYDNNGTNVFFAPANEPKLFEVNQNNGNINFYPNASGTFNLANGMTMTGTNGPIIKSNGKLNSSVAFDSTDANEANLSAGWLRAGLFQTSGNSSTNGFFDSSGCGWNTWGGGSLSFETSAGARYMQIDNTGFYPLFGTDNSELSGLLGAFVTDGSAHETYSSNNAAWSKCGAYRFISPYCLVAPGTTGAKTINFPSGSIRIAAAGSSVVLTDSYVTTNSIVYPVIATHDTTAYMVQAVPGSGSCTFYLNAAATSEVEIRFLVINSGQ